MASPSVNGSQTGSHPPSSTAPPAPTTVPVNGHNSTARPPAESQVSSINSEQRASQTPVRSPSLGQAPSSKDRGPSPQNVIPIQEPSGLVKSIVETDEYAQLSSLIKSSRAETVRQAIRDHWQRCITGSDFHVGFILNTALHHSSQHILEQAVKDFGSKLASSTKHQWVQHLSTEDVDEISGALLKRASDGFLDRAIARRFETISGRALVNALARAERLGYDTRDIVEEKNSSTSEHVIPSMHPSTSGLNTTNGLPLGHSYPLKTPHYSQPLPSSIISQFATVPSSGRFLVSHPTPSQLEEVKPLGIIFCDICGRPCSGITALENHHRKGACNNHVSKVERLENDTCLHCGVWFTSNGGLVYHNKSKVCGDYSSNVRLKMLELLSERAKIPVAKSGQTQSSLGSSPAPTAWQPAPSSSYQVSSQARPSTARPDPAEAYAALSPQQQANFDAEMKHAEDTYGAQMRQAMSLPPAQAEAELNKIKNRLNSRQSNLRKKYGIKLRDRRSRAQIEADNARIAANSPRPASRATVGVKRPLPAQADSPRKRVPLSEMSGLTGAAASAETTDPTLHMTPTQPQSIPIHRITTQAPTASQSVGTREDPMAIDSDRSTMGPGSSRPSPPVGTGTGTGTPAGGSRPTSAGGA